MELDVDCRCLISQHISKYYRGLQTKMETTIRYITSKNDRTQRWPATPCSIKLRGKGQRQTRCGRAAVAETAIAGLLSRYVPSRLHTSSLLSLLAVCVFLREFYNRHTWRMTPSSRDINSPSGLVVAALFFCSYTLGVRENGRLYEAVVSRPKSGFQQGDVHILRPGATRSIGMYTNCSCRCSNADRYGEGRRNGELQHGCHGSHTIDRCCVSLAPHWVLARHSDPAFISIKF